MSNLEDFKTRYLGKWYFSPNEEMARSLRDYGEKENRLIGLTGFDMEKLIELFAAGYTLQPPDYSRRPMFFEEMTGKGEKDESSI